MTDNILQFANQSEAAWQQFREDLRTGRSITEDQADAQRDFNRQIQELRQELLLGGLEILRVYLPAIKAIIGAFTNGITWILEFIAQNKEIVIILASVAVSIATVTVGQSKAAALAVTAFQTAQAALAAISVVGWANPFIASLAAIGIALGGVIWLLSRFKSTTEEVNRLETPDYTAGISRAEVSRAADRYRSEAQREVDALRLDRPAAPAERPAQRPTAPSAIADLTVRRGVIDDLTVRRFAAPAQPVSAGVAAPLTTPASGAARQVVNNIHIEVVAHASDAPAQMGDRLAAELSAAIDAGIWGRNG